MKKNAFIAVMALGGLTACGPVWVGHSNNTVTVPGPTEVITVPAPVDPVLPETAQQEVVDLLLDENNYRLSLGQTELSQGLSCSIQLVGTGQWLSSSSPGYVAAQGVVTALAGSASYAFLKTDSFNQVNATSGPNSLIPVALQPLYVGQNYKLSCSGQLVITDTEYYGFDLNSDDGSILTIDGTQVVNDDGNHGMTLKSGTKLLRRGVHTFSLLYAQSGGGAFGLILKSNGSVLNGLYFAH